MILYVPKPKRKPKVRKIFGVQEIVTVVVIISNYCSVLVAAVPTNL